MLSHQEKNHSLIQRNPYKAMRGFLNKNLTDQERTERYIQRAEAKNTANQECFIQQSCPSELKTK